MVDESPSPQGSAPKAPMTDVDFMGVLTQAVTLVLSRIDTRPADKTLPDLRVGLVELDRLLKEWIDAAVATNRAAEHFRDKPDDFFPAAYSQQLLSHRVFDWLSSELGREYDPRIPATQRSDADTRINTETLQRLFEIYAPEVRADILNLLQNRRQLINDLLASYASTFDRYGGSSSKKDDFMNQLNRTLEDLREAQYRLRAYIRESFPLHS
jgi:hypothetical protein